MTILNDNDMTQITDITLTAEERLAVSHYFGDLSDGTLELVTDEDTNQLLKDTEELGFEYGEEPMIVDGDRNFFYVNDAMWVSIGDQRWLLNGSDISDF